MTQQTAIVGLYRWQDYGIKALILLKEDAKPMDLNLEEQKLLADFRRLDDTGRQELLRLASLLVNKSHVLGLEESAPASNQCNLPSREKRPETNKEPIFTE